MPRILVADDDDQFRRMVVRTLERAGYQVEPAADGREALQRFSANPADLVLTDLVMPEKEGLETIMELRRVWKTPRIIAMSGGGRCAPEEYLDAARVLGVAATLEKPFATKDLLAAVRSVLGEGEKREGRREKGEGREEKGEGRKERGDESQAKRP